MSDSTFITRVVLENYKSIPACDVRLEPLTFLVGPNGAGKSNFLDALRFVRDGLTTTLDQAVRQRGGSRKLFHDPAGPSGVLRIHLEFRLPSATTGSYGFQLRQTPPSDSAPSRWEVLEEECCLRSANASVAETFRVRDGQVHGPNGSAAPVHRDRLYLVNASTFPAFRPVYDALTGMTFHQIQPKSIPDIDQYDPAERLREDGSNLASTLLTLRHTDPSFFERVTEYLRVVLPGLKRVSVEPVFHNGASPPPEPDRIALVFQQVVGRNVALFGPLQMSEGTLRALAILTALYQVVPYEKSRPPLTAIEDVEAAVHPSALTALLDALEESSLTTQVLVTTQSSDLLDKRQIAPGSLLAVAADRGVTRIGPVREAAQASIRDRRYTFGELLRIGQLEPEGLSPWEPAAALDGGGPP